MEVDHKFLETVSRKVGGSFYIFDSDVFESNISRLRKRLRNHHSNSEVAYALKANYMPPMVKILADIEAMGEVVSRLEYDIASFFLPPDRIVFNGPVKRIDDLKHAIEGGSYINIDSFCEIRYLEKLSPNFNHLTVGLRVNLDMLSNRSRFGFSVEGGELDEALGKISAIGNISVTGLHCHISTRDKSVRSYEERTEALLALRDKLKLDHEISTINIGGGFFGDMPRLLKEQMEVTVPTLEEYADAIGRVVKNHVEHRDELRLIVEPGISMAANSMCFAAEVIEMKQRDSYRQVLVDTNINNVNPTRSQCQPIIVPYVKENSSAGLLPTRVVGNTCMEHDVVYEGNLPPLVSGDFLVFENRGAYSINYTPPFITTAPCVVDSNGRVLKHAEGGGDIINMYPE